MATAPASVYWVGQDGNVWLKGPSGTQNVGSATGAAGGGGNYNLSNGGFESNTLKQSVQAQRINDPSPGGVNPNASNSGSGSSGAGSGAVYPDKSTDITLQQAGLGTVDATQNTGISRVDKALATIMGEYDADAANAKTAYTTEGNANQTDLQSNKETSLQNAVQGRRGLFGTLASLGALSGTGIDLANSAVQKGANSDLTTAANTFATNQNALDSGYNAFTTQDKTRRTQATAAHDNDVEQVQNDAAKARQAYLTNIANDYQAEGNMGQAKAFAAQAASLFPSIASTNVPNIDIGYSGSAYTAPTLSQYVGKANNTTVQSTPPPAGGGLLNIPGLVALNKKQTAGAAV